MSKKRTYPQTLAQLEQEIAARRAAKKQKQEEAKKKPSAKYEDLPTDVRELINDFRWGPRQDNITIKYLQSRPIGAYGPREEPNAKPRYWEHKIPYNMRPRDLQGAISQKLEQKIREYTPFGLRAITPNLPKYKKFQARKTIFEDKEWYDEMIKPGAERTNPLNNYIARDTYAAAFDKPRPTRPMFYEK